MKRLSLNGVWQLHQLNADKTTPISAHVPGNILSDLVRNGVIRNPQKLNHDQQLGWISQHNWLYRRTFELDRDFVRLKQIILRCDGLDTLTLIRINGFEIGTTENMFRTYEFSVKKVLRAGTNTIEIEFTPPTHSDQHLRKARFHGGSEVVPALPNMGIWRDITLLGVKQGRIDDIDIVQTHKENTATVSVRLHVSPRQRETVTAVISLARNGLTIMDNRRITFDGDSTEVIFDINRPPLWSPQGVGSQDLYEVLVGLFDRELNQLDYSIKRFGLREVRVEYIDNRLKFFCNGQQIYVRGAHWLPPHAYSGESPADKYRNLLKAARDANINLLRVWGQGIYEDERFYHICDELGIMVWHDIIGINPDQPRSSEYVEELTAELEENIQRIQHHACIVVWSAPPPIADIIREIEPTITVLPHTPHGDESPKPTSETFLDGIFGFPAYPAPETMREIVGDLSQPFTSSMMQYHQRTVINNHTILDNIDFLFRTPKNTEQAIWLSQLMQGRILQLSLEKWRREMATVTGTIFWHLNDIWSYATGSAIDWQGNRKALYYMVRRAYAPILLSSTVDADAYKVDLFVSSDRHESATGTLTWQLTTVTGETIIAPTEQAIAIEALSSRGILTLDLAPYANQYGTDDLLLWVKLCDEEHNTISQDLVTLVAPKHLELPKPTLTVNVIEETDDGFIINVNSDATALYVWLTTSDAHFEDNFFHMLPNSSRTLHLTAKHLSPIRVHSLVDTYQ